MEWRWQCVSHSVVLGDGQEKERSASRVKACVCPFLHIGEKICGLKWECMENMQCIDLGILIMVL